MYITYVCTYNYLATEYLGTYMYKLPFPSQGLQAEKVKGKKGKRRKKRKQFTQQAGYTHLSGKCVIVTSVIDCHLCCLFHM